MNILQIDNNCKPGCRCVLCRQAGRWCVPLSVNSILCLGLMGSGAAPSRKVQLSVQTVGVVLPMSFLV